MKTAWTFTGKLLLFVLVGLLIIVPQLIAAAESKGFTPGEQGAEIYHPGLVSYRVGSYFLAAEDYEKAIAEFTETIQLLPTFSYAYAARGDSYAAMEQYDLAIADYDQALALVPDFASAYYTRGLAHTALGNAEQAILDFNLVIKLVPDVSLPYRGLGDVYYTHGEYEQALLNYQLYLLLTGDTKDAVISNRVQQLQATVDVEQNGT